MISQTLYYLGGEYPDGSASRAMISQTLYYLGGEYPDGSASRAMWRYDPVLNAWHEMAGMNVCRYKIWIIFSLF